MAALQNPGSRPQFNNINWGMAQRAIADDYQRLIWGPAEILNGRMASEGLPSCNCTALLLASCWACIFRHPSHSLHSWTASTVSCCGSTCVPSTLCGVYQIMTDLVRSVVLTRAHAWASLLRVRAEHELGTALAASKTLPGAGNLRQKTSSSKA